MKVHSKKMKVMCKRCKRKFKIRLAQEDLDSWRYSELPIEDCLHYLTVQERGLLESGMCNCSLVSE